MTIASGNKALAADVLKSLNASGYLQLVDLTATTIASGAITVTKNWYSVDTEGAAATDDLDTITAGSDVNDGHLLFLRPANDARTVVIKHGTGNIKTFGGVDITLDDSSDMVAFIYDGNNSRWLSINPSPAVTDGTTLQTSAGVMSVVSGGVTATQLASNAVTTAKINDSAVTTAKINDDAVTAAKIVAGAVGATEIANTVITSAHLASSFYTTGNATVTYTSTGGGFMMGDNVTLAYTKIGRLVVATGYIDATPSSPTGSMYLEGLPYTSDTGGKFYSSVSIFATGLETTATTSIMGRILDNSSKVELYKYSAGTASSLVGGVANGFGFGLIFTIVYFTT